MPRRNAGFDEGWDRVNENERGSRLYDRRFRYDWNDRYGGRGDMAQGRFDESRESQQEALGYYQDMIEGRGPSVAEKQMQAGADRNIAAQMQLAAQGRGGNMAASQRQAAQQGAGQQMVTNQQLASLRAQEQQAAMGGYAGMANQMAGQDLQAQMGYDQLQGQMYLGQLQADDAYALESRRQAEQEYQNKFGRWMGGIKMFGKALGGAMQAMGGMSDIRQKENIRPYGAPPDLPPETVAISPEEEAAMQASSREALANLGSYEFQYRDPERFGQGNRIGVMAQDLAANPQTSGLVIPTEEGLAVDGAGLAQLGVAASADQERRLQEQERERREMEARLEELEAQRRASKDKKKDDGKGMGIGMMSGAFSGMGGM